MTRPLRPALILLLACVPAAVAGSVHRGVAQARDSTGDTLPEAVQSAAAAHRARLDSLRQRSADLRAAILRLRVRYGARVQRVESGLRFRLPYRLNGERDPAGERDRRDPVLDLADVARRFYPAADVAVLGTAGGDGPGCGTRPERRRAGAVVERLRELGGLDPARVRRAECSRAQGLRREEESPAGEGAADRGSAPGIILYIDWDRPADPS